jgi:hypothetical protein
MAEARVAPRYRCSMSTAAGVGLAVTARSAITVQSAARSEERTWTPIDQATRNIRADLHWEPALSGCPNFAVPMSRSPQVATTELLKGACRAITPAC